MVNVKINVFVDLVVICTGLKRDTRCQSVRSVMNLWKFKMKMVYNDGYLKKEPMKLV